MLLFFQFDICDIMDIIYVKKLSGKQSTLLDGQRRTIGFISKLIVSKAWTLWCRIHKT